MVVILLYQAYQLPALFLVFNQSQDIAETHNGIQRRTYLMADIRQEGRLQPVALLGTVTGFDEAENLMEVRFDDRICSLDFSQLDELGIAAYNADGSASFVAEPAEQTEGGR